MPYDPLFGRPFDMEWAYLNKTFHDENHARADRAPLTPGEAAAVAEGETLAATV